MSSLWKVLASEPSSGRMFSNMTALRPGWLHRLVRLVNRLLSRLPSSLLL